MAPKKRGEKRGGAPKTGTTRSAAQSSGVASARGRGAAGRGRGGGTRGGGRGGAAAAAVTRSPRVTREAHRNGAPLHTETLDQFNTRLREEAEARRRAAAAQDPPAGQAPQQAPGTQNGEASVPAQRRGRDGRGGNRSGRRRNAEAEPAVEAEPAAAEPAEDEPAPECDLENGFPNGPAAGPAAGPTAPTAAPGTAPNAPTAPTATTTSTAPTAPTAPTDPAVATQPTAPATQAPQQQPSGSGSGNQAPTTQNAGQAQPGGKRAHDGDDADQPPAQRSRPSERGRQATGYEPPDDSDPCGALRRNLSARIRIRDGNYGRTRAATRKRDEAVPRADRLEGVARSDGLDADLVYRAIATVTEAIAQNEGSSTFTLLHPQAWQAPDEATMLDFFGPNVAARLGNEALIPFWGGSAGGRGHISLFILRRGQVGRFVFRHYDTANEYREHSSNHVRNGYTIQQALERFGWPSQNPNDAIPSATDPGHLGRQPPQPPRRNNNNNDENNGECGIFVILFAWAHALGLNFSAFQVIPSNRLGSFRNQAVQLVNLALEGALDPTTIRQFLRCYGIVPMDSQIPRNRLFEHTVAFLTDDDYQDYVARTRITDDVARIREGAQDNLSDLEPDEFFQHGQDRLGPRWRFHTGEEFVRATRQLADERERQADAGNEDPPEGSGGSGGAGGNDNAGGNGQAQGAGSITGKGKGKAKADEDGTGKDTQGAGSKGAKKQAGDNGSTGQQASGPERNHCKEFEDAMSYLRKAGNTPALDDPVREREELIGNTVWRAIATVTEAISEQGMVQFSVLDETSYQTQRGGDPGEHIEGDITLPAREDPPTPLRVGRPGQTFIIPYIPGFNHSSLFVFERMNNGSLRIVHHDSHHRDSDDEHRDQMPADARQVFRTLVDLGWLNAQDADRLVFPTPTEGFTTRQENNWACGLHVIFNGWAIALGLELSGNEIGGLYNMFIRDGVELVNLALQGQISSRTIEDFFRCYDFVTRTSAVPVQRVFDNTFPLPTNLAMTDRINRLRLQAELRDLQHQDPSRISNFDLNVLLRTLQDEENYQPDLTDLSADDLIDRVIQAQRAADERRAAVQHTPPGASSLPPQEPTSAEAAVAEARKAGVREEHIQNAIARELGRAAPEQQRNGQRTPTQPRNPPTQEASPERAIAEARRAGVSEQDIQAAIAREIGTSSATAQGNGQQNAASGRSSQERITELTQGPQRQDNETRLGENVADGDEAGPTNQTTQSNQIVQPDGDQSRTSEASDRLAPYNALIQRLVDEYLQGTDHGDDGPVNLMRRAIAWHDGTFDDDGHLLNLIARAALQRWQAANPGDAYVASAVANYLADSDHSSPSVEPSIESPYPGMAQPWSDQLSELPPGTAAHHPDEVAGRLRARDNARDGAPEARPDGTLQRPEVPETQESVEDEQQGLPNGLEDERTNETERRSPERRSGSGSPLSRDRDRDRRRRSRSPDLSRSPPRQRRNLFPRTPERDGSFDGLGSEGGQHRSPNLSDVDESDGSRDFPDRDERGSRENDLSPESTRRAQLLRSPPTLPPDLSQLGPTALARHWRQEQAQRARAIEEEEREQETQQRGTQQEGDAGEQDDAERRGNPIGDFASWLRVDYGGQMENINEPSEQDRVAAERSWRRQEERRRREEQEERERQQREAQQQSQENQPPAGNPEEEPLRPAADPVVPAQPSRPDPDPPSSTIVQPGVDADRNDDDLDSLFNGSTTGNTPQAQDPAPEADAAAPEDGDIPNDASASNVTAMMLRIPPEPLTIHSALDRLPGLPPPKAMLERLLAISPSAPNYPDLLDNIVKDPDYRPIDEIAPDDTSEMSQQDVEMSDVTSIAQDDDDDEMEQALMQELERPDDEAMEMDETDAASVTSQSRRLIDVFSGRRIGENDLDEEYDNYHIQQQAQGEWKGGHPHHHRRSQ